MMKSKASSASKHQTPPVLQQIRDHQREAFRTLGPAGAITLIGFIITFFFIEPAPPDVIRIATGPSDGNYYSSGLAYADFLKTKGIELQIQETAGSEENFKLLIHDKGTNLAIVQGGAVPKDVNPESFESIASLYLEPVWIFYRPGLELGRLGDFSGLTISIGRDGSGTQKLAKFLFAENGVSPNSGGTEFVNLGPRDSISKLKSGDIDALVLVLSPEAQLIRDLLYSSEVSLFSFDRNQAYSKRYGFLEAVTLERGVIDLEKDIPSEAINLVAPYANLIATPSFHDALIPLLLDAATISHFSGGLLADAGEFPSLVGSEFNNSEIAREYIEHGPSLFQRHLNFWVASLIDRAKIMLIPLIALLFPLIKLAPPIYRWRIRSRIYRWYAFLNSLDQKLRDKDSWDLEKYQAQLAQMEAELAELEVPLSYMQEFYDLHIHVDLIKRRLEAFNQEQLALNK
ncbi:MAG: ABC transporter substrate-binding protein [Pseudomonadales bacterium]|nr:ABC transporter substrate-binding protein [Pseudomonadales bacterium]